MENLLLVPISIFSLVSLLPPPCSGDFSSDRAALLASEAAMALGGDVVLDSLEEAANEKIMEAKEEELQVRRKEDFLTLAGWSIFALQRDETEIMAY